VLAGNTLPRPLVNAINRAPLDQAATEAIYEVHLTTDADGLDDSRELLRHELETTNYPLRDIEVIERDQGGIELVAVLTSTAADPAELDAIVTRLEQDQLVHGASWTSRSLA
jgi:putative Mg2+ transporter-C (MgtC) family protein